MMNAPSPKTRVTDDVVFSALPKDSFIYKYVEWGTRTGIAPAATYLASLLPTLSRMMPPNSRVRWAANYAVPTNMYTLIVGRSGIDRKSTGIDAVRTLLAHPLPENALIVAREAKHQEGDLTEKVNDENFTIEPDYEVGYRRLDTLVSKERFASGEALAEKLAKGIADSPNPEKGRLCIVWDELSTLLVRANGKNGQSDALKQDLTNYYDGGAGGIRARSYDHTIRNVDLSLVGGITPVYAQEMLDWKDLSGGFFSRFFVTMSYRDESNLPMYREDGSRLTVEDQNELVREMLTKPDGRGGVELLSITELLQRVREIQDRYGALKTTAPDDTEDRNELARWFWLFRDYLPEADFAPDLTDPYYSTANAIITKRCEVFAEKLGAERQGAWIRGYANLAKKFAAYFAAEDYLKSRMDEIQADLDRRIEQANTKINAADSLSSSWDGTTIHRLALRPHETCIPIRTEHIQAAYEMFEKIHWVSVEDFFEAFGNTQQMRLRSNVLSIIKRETQKNGTCPLRCITRELKVTQKDIQEVLRTLEMEICIISENRTVSLPTEPNRPEKVYRWLSDGWMDAPNLASDGELNSDLQTDLDALITEAHGPVLVPKPPIEVMAAPPPKAATKPALRVVNTHDWEEDEPAAPYDPYMVGYED